MYSNSGAHFTAQALLSSLCTPTAQHCVPTRTESDVGRIVLTQQTLLPRHSTGLDCSESGFSYQCMFSACGSTSLQWLKQHENVHVYLKCATWTVALQWLIQHVLCIPEGNSLDGLLTCSRPNRGRGVWWWLAVHNKRFTGGQLLCSCS